MLSLIRKHRVLGLLAVVFGVGLMTQSALAAESPLTQEEQTIFSQNHIVFYEPCSDISGSSALRGEVSISGNTAEEKVWSGLTSFLTDEQTAGVMGNMAYENGNYGPVRRESGQQGDIWNSGTQMGMGLIQWSFGRRVKLLNYVKSQDAEMIKYFEDETLKNVSGDGFIEKYGHETANRIYQLELQYLKQELDTVQSYHGIYDQKTVEGAADFFLEHVEIPANIAGQRPLRRMAANKMFAKYSGKTFTGNGVSSSTVGVANSTVTSNINDKAWELADQTRDQSLKGPTEAYLQAQKSVKCPGDCIDHGASCDRYVATVVRAAGVDDNIPWGNVATQEDYMIKTSNIYMPVEGDATNEATYQPGDIRVKIVNGVRKHIEIYGQKDGKGYILSASIDDPKRWAGYTDFFAENGAEYHIYRTQGTPKCVVSNGCQQNTMDVNSTAVCLAWPLGTKDSKKLYHGGKPTEAFKTAIDAVFPDRDWARQTNAGASCDVGAATVVRYSGVDKTFPRGLDEQFALASKGDRKKWEVIRTTSKSALKPGDVVLKSGHVWIYVEDQNGKKYRVDAHHNWKGGMYLGVEDSLDSVQIILRAKNAKNSTNGVVIEKDKSSVGGETVSDSGSTSSSASSTNTNDARNKKDINAAAIELAWPADASKSSSNYPGGDWNEAGRKAASEFKKETGAGLSDRGADCGDFANVVLWYAGIIKDKKGGPASLYKYMKEDTANWEEVEIKSKSDLQPGDIGIRFNSLDLCAPYKGGCHQHIAFYVEQNGEAYTSQASHGGFFGRLSKGVSDIFTKDHVMRYKGGASTDDNCDRCQNTSTDDFGLKEGGLTLAEAKKWMETYRQEASKKKTGSYMFKSAYVLDAGCGGGTLNNCVAFSQWFLNKYTSIGPKWANTVNGNKMVSHLKATKGLKTGNEPRPYAIFSTGTYNHTGVVMGVTNNSVVVCEASCSNGYTSYWPGCSEWLMDTTKSKSMTYAYTDDIMNNTGGGGGNW